MKLTIYMFFLLALTNCQFNATYQNQSDDKEDAEHITNLLYAYLESKEYSKTHEFFSPKFYEVSNVADLDKAFKKGDEILGDIKTKELKDWQTNTVKGSNAQSQYILIYDVTRTKFHSTETITLTKENNKVKILGYNVQSEGFLK